MAYASDSEISTAFGQFLVTSDLAPAIRDLQPSIEAAALRLGANPAAPGRQDGEQSSKFFDIKILPVGS